jgi:hypothetical protein
MSISSVNMIGHYTLLRTFTTFAQQRSTASVSDDEVSLAHPAKNNFHLVSRSL